jgi:hypothetical protein
MIIITLTLIYMITIMTTNNTMTQAAHICPQPQPRHTTHTLLNTYTSTRHSTAVQWIGRGEEQAPHQITSQQITTHHITTHHNTSHHHQSIHCIHQQDDMK